MTSCEGKLTVKECWNALDSMGNNKSPGNDGFTKEFYLAFFNDLNQYLVDSLNFSLVNGEFSSSQKQAVITLIEKKDRDKRILKNWRPISLINIDVKIASNALALRVRNVMHELVHSDQTAYVKDRYIGESMRIIDDILEYTECNQVPSLVYFVGGQNSFWGLPFSFNHTNLSAQKDLVTWVPITFASTTHKKLSRLELGVSLQFMLIGTDYANE